MDPAVQEVAVVLQVGVAVALVRVRGEVPAVGGVGVGIEVAVQVLPVRVLAHQVGVVAAQAEFVAIAECVDEIAAHVGLFLAGVVHPAVGGVVVVVDALGAGGGVKAEPLVDLAAGGEQPLVGVEAAVLAADGAAQRAVALFGDQVDHPAHGGRAVQGRTRSLDHLHPLDPVEVDLGRVAGAGAVAVDEQEHVAGDVLAVGLGAEAAQADRGVHAAVLLQVAGDVSAEQFTHGGGPGLFDGLPADHLGVHGQIDGPLLGAAGGDDHLLGGLHDRLVGGHGDRGRQQAEGDDQGGATFPARGVHLFSSLLA